MDERLKILFDVLPQWDRYIGRTMKCALPDGISPPMEFALSSVRRPLTMSELARAMRISKQQTTKISDRLIELGFAQRLPDEHDRRIVRLYITDAGRRHMEITMQDTVSGLDALFSSMEEEDRERFVEALGMMKRVFRDLDDRSTDRE